ncbi:bifunctional phosphopantothenoylcysteine decarboxylase/phosphopantothenate--cysteine ligase CoaBC [Fibrobacterota bacterium]
MQLKKKNILLGITGSISVYKSCDLVQRLKEEGAEVRVVMTRSAAALVSPLTFTALTGHPALIDIFNRDSATAMDHIGLAEWADVYLIAPCTAHTIGELANGLTGSLVSLISLAFPGKTYIAPAMNSNMLASMVVRENLKKLEHYGKTILPSGTGMLACGKSGEGKLLDGESIVEYLKTGESLSSPYPALKNKKCLIVLGHSRERIDDVRFISNRSSGRTGLAMAKALRICGAKVHMICGYLDTHISNEYPESLLERVSTTEEFYRAVTSQSGDFDIIIMAAALADFIPRNPVPGKTKHSNTLKSIQLKPSPNVLETICAQKKAGQIIVGFALENKGKENLGLKKLSNNDMDLMVLNTIDTGPERSGIGFEKTRAMVLKKKSRIPRTINKLPLISKQKLADVLLKELSRLSLK